MDKAPFKKRAIIICGDEAKGLSLAIQIAAADGPYSQIAMDEFQDHWGLEALVHECPTTLIVQGPFSHVLSHKFTLDRLKSLISSETVKVNRLAKPRVDVKTPNLIFVSGHVDPFPSIDQSDRRFMVVHIDKTPA
jgi:hypothetical protein